MVQISHLATPAYWCDIYEREREVLANQGAVGEEWFSEKQDAILDWINENWESWNAQSIKKNAVCLDVGTGNGIFPLRLAGNNHRAELLSHFQVSDSELCTESIT